MEFCNKFNKVLKFNLKFCSINAQSFFGDELKSLFGKEKIVLQSLLVGQKLSNFSTIRVEFYDHYSL